METTPTQANMDVMHVLLIIVERCFIRVNSVHQKTKWKRLNHTFCPYAPGRKKMVAKLKIVRNGRRGGGVMLFYDTAIILTPTPLDYTNMEHVHSQLSRLLSQ